MSQNKLLDNTAPDLRGPQWTLSSRRPDAWCFAWVNFRLHKVNQFRVYVALTALAGQSTQCCPAPGAVEAIAVLPSSAVQKALGELNELGVVVSRPGVEPARPVLHTIVIVEPSEDGGAA